MELREWAIRILSGERIEEKLLDPLSLSDENPGSALLWKEPSRPQGMGFIKHERSRDRLPKPEEFSDPDKIAICLHRFGGHELLAVEMMAYALLAFPNAPRSFRMGVANTLKEEQGHVRLYSTRLKEMGVEFGDLPLYKHFWRYTKNFTSPIEYVSIMSLTLEMANLDHAPFFGAAFQKVGDAASFDLMKTILTDEIAHVGFGMAWFKKLQQKDRCSWEVYKDSLPLPLSPNRARGPLFNEESRKKASVPRTWIQNLSLLN
jgi:uncharacterized ferritin-like protein (DUF455 family)